MRCSRCSAPSSCSSRWAPRACALVLPGRCLPTSPPAPQPLTPSPLSIPDPTPFCDCPSSTRLPLFICDGQVQPQLASLPGAVQLWGSTFVALLSVLVLGGTRLISSMGLLFGVIVLLTILSYYISLLGAPYLGPPQSECAAALPSSARSLAARNKRADGRVIWPGVSLRCPPCSPAAHSARREGSSAAAPRQHTPCNARLCRHPHACAPPMLSAARQPPARRLTSLPVRRPVPPRARPPRRFALGLSASNLALNGGPAYQRGESFASNLSLFFPCFCGFLSGANRASALQSPQTAIPLGTLGAVCTSLCLYLSFFLVRRAPPRRRAALAQAARPVRQASAHPPSLPAARRSPRPPCLAPTPRSSPQTARPFPPCARPPARFERPHHRAHAPRRPSLRCSCSCGRRSASAPFSRRPPDNSTRSSGRRCASCGSGSSSPRSARRCSASRSRPSCCRPLPPTASFGRSHRLRGSRGAAVSHGAHCSPHTSSARARCSSARSTWSRRSCRCASCCATRR